MKETSNTKLSIYIIGNILMWYSYTLFIPFFLIISSTCFPKMDKTVNMILCFVVFGLGLLTRPIGSYLFGKIGDLICREKAIGTSLAILSISTIATGLLPSYEFCGIISTLLLTVFRALQGIAMGGAANISIVQLVETAPQNKKGIIGCIPNASNLIGLLISNVIFSMLYYLFPLTVQIHIWRIPFLLSVTLLPIAAFYFRSRKCSVTKEKDQPFSLLKQHKSAMLCAFLLTAFSATSYYSVFAFLPNYMMSHYAGQNINIVTITNMFLIISIFIGGHISDKFGLKPILFASLSVSLLSILLALCCNTRTAIQVLIPTIGISLALYYGVSGPFITHLFPKEVRCTAVSLSMSTSQAVFGSMIPIILTKITSYSFRMFIIPLLIVTLLAGIATFISKARND